MPRLVSLLIACALVLTACESPPRNAEPPLGDTTVTTPGGSVGDTTFAEQGSPGVPLQTIIDRSSDRDPATEDLTVLDELNEPQRVTTETQENRHVPGQVDTLRTWHYDGLELTVHHAGDRELLRNVTVTIERYEMDRGLRVGMSRSELEEVLGQPETTTDGDRVYSLGGELPTMLHAEFDGDMVTRLEWRFPID